MITIIIFLLFTLLLIIEGVSVWGNKRSLSVSFSVDTRLVEPGEEATLYYTVLNPYRLPFFYVGFSLFLNADVAVCEGEEFCRVHVRKTDAGTSISHHFALPGSSKFSGKVRISLKGRGVHELGQYFIETGDFFGAYPVIVSEHISRKIICTCDKGEEAELVFPGGQMGDISVRRFIMDDPTMILGYREYTGTEPMKQISWNQTAKAGRLMVRQNDFTTDQVAVVLVDMYSSNRPALEECLKLTRTVCEQLEEARIPFELATNGDLLTLPEGTGRAHLYTILRRLGVSKLMGYYSFERLVEQCAGKRRVSCCYIVIAPEFGPEHQGLVEYLARFSDVKPIVMQPERKEEAL